MRFPTILRSAGVFLLAALLIAGIVWPTFAGTASADGTWLGNLTVQKQAVVASTERLAAQKTHCTLTTLEVIRLQYTGSLGKVSETHCMVTTLAGLMDINGEIIVPHGFSTGYPIKNYASFSRSFLPVPGQAAVLAIAGDPSWPGVNMGIYRNFYDHLKINVAQGYFELHDNPDVMFKYATGRNLAFNISGVQAFADDGRYLITDAVYEGLMRIDLLTLQMQTFEATLPRINNGGLLSAYADVTSDGRYVAVSYPGGWGDPYAGLYDIDSCTNAVQAADAYVGTSIACAKKDIRQMVLAQNATITTTDGVRFTSDRTLLIDAYGSDKTYSRYQIVPTGIPEHLVQYLAMGDSFSSGEGTFNYKSGTDTNLNKCHQSALSYPYLLATDMSSFASLACSGATTDNIFANNKEHKDTQLSISDNEVTSAMQTDALTTHAIGVITQGKFLKQDNPEVVTITIGGNDVQFSGILKRCVLPFAGDITPATDCYVSYEDRLEVVNAVNAQFDNLVNTYKLLKQDNSSRRVYVIGYPQIASTTGSCALNVRLSQADREFGAELVSYLNSVIKQAAAKAGVYYVDTEHALDGHRLCDGVASAAVNGLTAGNDTALHTLGNESYHPNELGHQLLANAINGSTANLTAGMPPANDSLQAPVVSDELSILQAPKTQRPINEVLNGGDDSDLIRQIQSGQSATFDYGQFNKYLAPNTAGTASLHSDPVSLGNVQVDTTGQIHTQLTIPPGTSPGIHTVHIYVTNIAGQPVDIQTVVYVSASSDDMDGDGIPNATDSCADVANSLVDADKDGVDDVCDVEVASLPLGPAETVPQDTPKPEEPASVSDDSDHSSAPVSSTQQNSAPTTGSEIENGENTVGTDDVQRAKETTQLLNVSTATTALNLTPQTTKDSIAVKSMTYDSPVSQTAQVEQQDTLDIKDVLGAATTETNTEVPGATAGLAAHIKPGGAWIFSTLQYVVTGLVVGALIVFTVTKRRRRAAGR